MMTDTAHTADVPIQRPAPPRGWLLMLGQLGLGFVLADGPGALIRFTGFGRFILVALLWIILLAGGARVMEQRRQTSGPGDRMMRSSLLLGIVMLLLGQLASFRFPSPFPFVYSVGVICALAYAGPPFRLRSRPAIGWMLAVIVLGFLTPLAAWTATGRPIAAFAIWSFAGLALEAGALIPLAELHRLPALRIVGEHSIAARLGPTRAARIAALLVFLGFLCMLRAVSLEGSGILSWLALAAAGAGWVLTLAPWQQYASVFTPDQQEQGYWTAAAAYVATGIALVYALAM
jgi:hypothetical protein